MNSEQKGRLFNTIYYQKKIDVEQSISFSYFFHFSREIIREFTCRTKSMNPLGYLCAYKTCFLLNFKNIIRYVGIEIVVIHF